MYVCMFVFPRVISLNIEPHNVHKSNLFTGIRIIMFIEFHLKTTCTSNPSDSLNLSNTKNHVDLLCRKVSLPLIAKRLEDIADRACLPFFLVFSLSIRN